MLGTIIVETSPEESNIENGCSVVVSDSIAYCLYNYYSERKRLDRHRVLKTKLSVNFLLL